MNWFRSNIRLGSRLALFALAIQFLLSFGHFHSSSAPEAGLGDTVALVAAHSAASEPASQESASRSVRLNSSSGHEPAGPPADDCAICTVMALASAVVAATPPYLPAPQATAFLDLATEAEFVDLNSARIAFQPRAPPIV